MVFDDREYTQDAIVKQLGLVELHSKDGSALEAGCKCIETKHLYLLEGLAEEGIGFSKTEKERQFYTDLADYVRRLRKNLEVENFSMPHAHNPRGRDYLPHSLTECESHYISVQKKLKSCIKETEIKCCGEHTTDYSGCVCNPVAVCRASIPCPPVS